MDALIIWEHCEVSRIFLDLVVNTEFFVYCSFPFVSFLKLEFTELTPCFFLNVYLLFLKERERARAGEGQREGNRGSKVGSELTVAARCGA